MEVEKGHHGQRKAIDADAAARRCRNQKENRNEVAEAGSSAEKKVTPKNALLGLQHVLVSNVWLDPVFVAGAIGLPLALSSNMVNAIFIERDQAGDDENGVHHVRRQCQRQTDGARHEHRIKPHV